MQITKQAPCKFSTIIGEQSIVKRQAGGGSLIKIRVNGEECEMAHGINIGELLKSKNYEIKYVAVEHNS